LSVILNRIRKRITKHNKNALILICGGTGSGKSLSAIKIAREINPKFDIREHLVFTAKEFMKLLNSGTLKKGDCLIWDEAGVGLPARQWYSILNKAVSYVLQTFRHQNLCVIFTTPNISFVDISLRRLFHYYFETVVIDFKRNICILKPFEIQMNPRLSKPYTKYPRTRKKGRIIKLTRLDIKLLNQKDIDLYEGMKQRFTKQLNIRLGKTIDKVEAKRMKEPKDIGLIVDDVKKNLTDYTKERGGRIIVNPYLIMARHKIGKPTSLKVKAIIENWLKNTHT